MRKGSELYNSQTIFGFAKAGRLYDLLTLAEAQSGVIIPDGVAFHAFRHTYGAWMRRAGVDTAGLVATGRWKNPQSAAVYEHVDASEEARTADLLPTRVESVRIATAEKKQTRKQGAR